MSFYSISKIYPGDHFANNQIQKLLEEEGIRRDPNLDYTCGMYDEDMNIIATGSLFGNTLRCMAVSHQHQGEGLMNEIVTHLIEVQFERGNTHLFLYTKCDTAKFFKDLGFYEIARVSNQLVFMENRRTGFSDYLKELKTACPEKSTGSIAALVMNANPFTNGHLYLVEKAAAENDVLHLFMVSEDASLIPYSVRRKLIMEATSHLPNICYHDSGPYIISNATFPSYFQKDESSVITGHAQLDLTIFKLISEALHINRRYVGEEPTSQVTGIYNKIMAEELPKADIECIIVPRLCFNKAPVSASTVRQAIHDDKIDSIKPLVPETTYRFFTSPEADEIIKNIQKHENVIHY
ncbi:MAG: [citrate (pro-3S)-lyase] ligase [Eubacteriales bacterium]|nr:[citrate (pro-3S)-lyase] ligase [Eubacteriales bacterium]